MHIRVNLKPNTEPCVFLTVRSDDYPKTEYRFLHTFNSQSLSCYYFLRHISFDDDRYLDFKSEVPLSEWLEKIKQSEYNDPKRYHMLTHNCAHGTNFALEAAGIKLFRGNPYFILNRFDFPTYLRLPKGWPTELSESMEALANLRRKNDEPQVKIDELLPSGMRK